MKLYKNFIILIITVIAGFSNLISQDTVIINKAALKENLKYLASDELKGRFPGTDGIEKAAQYIEKQFSTIGLKSFNNSYRQSFEVTTSLSAGQKNAVSFETYVQRVGIPKEKWPKLKQPWKPGEDFSPLAFSENGSVSGEIAFVGFGITAPELNYDDYAGIDVKDKIVILLSDSPEGEKRDGEFAQYTDLRYKATNARNKGAKAIIMAKIQGDSMNVFERLDYANIGRNSGILAIQAWRQTISKYFPKNKILIEIEDGIKNTKKPNSFLIPNVNVEITVDLIENKSSTYNIYGMIEGSDPVLKNEYIVIGAHYDHLGYGGPTSMYGGKKPLVHNGADDNASGVTGIIELARIAAQKQLKRSVIFCAFSGEEMGLLGSAAFIKNPPVNPEKMVAMYNFDMIGRLKEDLTVFGYASSDYFEGMLDSLALLSTIKITKASDAYGPSDHSTFYSAKIPVLMIFTGVHDDYHRPSDDFEKINFDGMAKVLEFSYKLLETVANKDLKPAYKEITTTERQPGKSSSYSNVWFGIIPNFEESPLGCKISGASPGSPAAKAGMTANDIITKINDSPIKNLYDFMYKIREYNPGDILNVTILRDSKEMIVKVTLAAKVQK